jgi:hypothetical protein
VDIEVSTLCCAHSGKILGQSTLKCLHVIPDAKPCMHHVNRTSDDEMGHRSKQRHFASLGVDTLESDALDVNDGAAHRLDNSGSTDVHASLVRSPPTRPFEDVLPSPGGKTR